VSHLSDNDKGDKEVKSWALHRSPGIYLMAEKNMNAVRPVIILNGVPYLQITPTADENHSVG
jgi:hypothetical protein